MFIAMDHLKSGRISLQDTTRVSENAWRMTGSQMFLEVGETVTIEQLLYGIAVVSGNDACVAPSRKPSLVPPRSSYSG